MLWCSVGVVGCWRVVGACKGGAAPVVVRKSGGGAMVPRGENERFGIFLLWFTA